MTFTMRIEVDAPFDAVMDRVRRALSVQGFGVLTEIDIKATFREKLGVEVEPQVILGACNPPLAHRALAADARVAALLPCNVVVRVAEGRTIVEALDPTLIAEVTGVAALTEIAAEAGQRLRAALDAVAGQS